MINPAAIGAWAYQAPAIPRRAPRESAAERAFRELAAGRAPAEVSAIARELALLSSRADGEFQIHDDGPPGHSLVCNQRHAARKDNR